MEVARGFTRTKTQARHTEKRLRVTSGERKNGNVLKKTKSRLHKEAQKKTHKKWQSEEQEDGSEAEVARRALVGVCTKVLKL